LTQILLELEAELRGVLTFFVQHQSDAAAGDHRDAGAIFWRRVSVVELVFVVLVVLCLLLDAVDLVAEVSARACPWAAPGRRSNDGATRALLASGGLFVSIVAAGSMLWGWGYWCVWGVVAESEACTDTSAGDAVANVFGTDAYRPSSATTFQGNWCMHACMYGGTFALRHEQYRP
jgi:hypothetical protein